jgi:hypothetical protein
MSTPWAVDIVRHHRDKIEVILESPHVDKATNLGSSQLSCGEQPSFAQCLTQLSRQGRQCVVLCAIARKLPVEIDPIIAISLNHCEQLTDKVRSASIIETDVAHIGTAVCSAYAQEHLDSGIMSATRQVRAGQIAFGAQEPLCGCSDKSVREMGKELITNCRGRNSRVPRGIIAKNDRGRRLLRRRRWLSLPVSTSYSHHKSAEKYKRAR